MLATSICREVHFTVLPSALQSRVPRCLFGSPNPRETVEMLQEALEMERTKFARRWGVDPGKEDKENCQKKYERPEKSPKKRIAPYSRQTNIHEFWRSRKVCDVSKKMSTSPNDAAKQNGADVSASLK